MVEVKFEKEDDNGIGEKEPSEHKSVYADSKPEMEEDYSNAPMKVFKEGEKDEGEPDDDEEEHKESKATTFGASYRRCTKETRNKVKKEERRVVSPSRERGVVSPALERKVVSHSRAMEGRGQTPGQVRREAMRKWEVEVEMRKVEVGRLKGEAKEGRSEDVGRVEVARSGAMGKVEVTPQGQGSARPHLPPPPGKGRDGTGSRREEQGDRTREQGDRREEQGDRRAPYHQLFPEGGLERQGVVPPPPRRLPAPPPLHRFPPPPTLRHLPAPPPLHHFSAPPPLHHSAAPPPRHVASSIPPRSKEQLERRLALDTSPTR